MPFPKVSVIVPAYNAARTIEETLRSALQQTISNIEILVVDDGSADNTVQLVESLGSDRIQVLRQQNQGPGAARHAGIQASSAPWIAFVDADDQWASKKLAVQLERAEIEQADVVYTGVSAIGDCDDVDAVHCPQLPSDDILKHLVVNNTLTLSSVMISRRAYDRFGGFSLCSSKRGTEDWDLWLRLAASGAKFAGCDEALTYYRWSMGNSSSNYSAMHLARLATLESFLASPEVSQLDEETIRVAKRNLFMTSAWFAASNGGAVRSLSWLAQSTLFGPEWKTARNVVGTLLRRNRNSSVASY